MTDSELVALKQDLIKLEERIKTIVAVLLNRGYCDSTELQTVFYELYPELKPIAHTHGTFIVPDKE